MSSNLRSVCDPPTQRLTKPRTYSSASNLLTLGNYQSQPSSPMTPTEHPLHTEDVTIQATQSGNRRSRRKSRAKIREYIHGHSSEDEEKDYKKGIKQGVKNCLTRSSSSLARIASGRSSTTQLLSLANGDLDEEDSELLRKTIEEKAHKAHLAAQNHVSEPIDDEDMHPDAMKSPIRRRSLGIPGLATRTPDDLLRKPPQPGQRHDQVLQYTCIEDPMPPAAHDFATFHPACNNGSAAFHHGRSTPTQFNQLGGFPIGSLRIANATSSASSIHGATLDTDDPEYYTASEGNRSEDDCLSMQSCLPRELSKPVRRSDSPLKYASSVADIESQRQAPPSPLEQSPALMCKRSLSQAESECQRSERQQSHYFPQNYSSAPCQDLAPDMAQAYISELPLSPYKITPSAIDKHQSNSSRPQDESQISELMVPSGSPVSNEDTAAQFCSIDTWQTLLRNDAEARHALSNTNEDALRILNGEGLPSNRSNVFCDPRLEPLVGDRGTNNRRESVSTNGSNILSRSDGSSGSEHMRARKAAAQSVYISKKDAFFDSGYVSRVESSKSLQNEHQAITAPDDYPRSKHYRTISDPADIPPQLLRGSEAHADPLRPYEANIQGRPTLDVVPRPHTTITTVVDSIPHSQSGSIVDTVTPSPPESPRIVARARSYHPLTPTQTLRDNTPRASATFETSPVTVRKLRKTKKTPEGIDMTAVQEITEMTNLDIPQIPAQLASRNAARAQQLPPLDYTCSNFKRDNLAGGHSPEDGIASVPIRFPSPSNSIEERGNRIMNSDIDWPKSTKKSKSKESKAMRSSTVKKHNRGMNHGEGLSEIADLGTVSHALGNSPYDVARQQNISRQRTSSFSSRCSPHHIGSDAARPKTVMGMDDDAALQASRFRASHYDGRDTFKPRTPHRAASQGMEGSSHHLSRPRSMFVGDKSHALPADDISFCQNRFIDGVQPYPMSAKVPPVPSLPSIGKTQHLEAMAQRDHQYNIPYVQPSTSDPRPAKLVRPRSLYAPASSPLTTSWPQENSHKQEEKIPCQREAPRSVIDESMTSKEHSRPKLERANTTVHPRILSSQLAVPQGNHLLSHQTSTTAGDKFATSSDISRTSNFDKHEPRLPVLDPSPTPGKLKKSRPVSAKPDMWKSDSLKDKLKTQTQETKSPSRSPMIDSKPIKKATASIDATPKRMDIGSITGDSQSHSLSRTPKLVHESLTEGKPRSAQFSWPVPAQSLSEAVSEALRIKQEKVTKSTKVSPLTTGASTPQVNVRSPISPLTTPSSPGPDGRPYFRQIRKPAEAAKGIPTPQACSRCPSPPLVVGGLAVGDMTIFPNSLQPRRKEVMGIETQDLNRQRQNLPIKSSPSPPKTPGKRFSLISSTSKK